MKIGIITSGGDSSGMNIVVNTIYEQLKFLNHDVILFKGGFLGIKNNKTVKYHHNQKWNINHLGGSYIGCGRYPELKTDPQARKNMRKQIEKLGISYLVVVGGNGSFKGAKAIVSEKTKVIGIPGTIDNDINVSDYSIGYDSALNANVFSIEQIVRSAISHSRFYIIQCMGGSAGQLAIDTAIATEADGVFTHEHPISVEKVSEIVKRKMIKKGYGFIIISDLMIKNLDEFAELVMQKAKTEIRIEILGRVQRGATPSGKERIMASKIALKTVDLINNKKGDCIVVFENNNVVMKNISTVEEKLDHRHENNSYDLFRKIKRGDQ